MLPDTHHVVDRRVVAKSPRRGRGPRLPLDDEEVRRLRYERLFGGEPLAVLSRKYHVPEYTVSRICLFRIGSHI
jgi:hypothetical protein